MEELATYYVTLKPTTATGLPAHGMTQIAYVPDPAIEEVGIYLSLQDKRQVVTDEISDKIVSYLESVGQELPKNWREVNEEEYLSAKKTLLSTDPTSSDSVNDFPDPNGGGQWLVRYQYDGPKDSKNRSFCARILGLNRIYTEEEIKNGLTNSEFGNYSIWDYKGSYGCRHTWLRKIYYEDYEDGEVRKVGNVPQVVRQLDDREATTLNAYLSADEKMQVCAPLLIPDKDIFRNDELGRYNMRFPQGTINDLFELSEQKEIFKREDLFKDTHRGGIAPSYVLDTWIIQSENDKAYTEYGFEKERVPVGSWMVLSQVTDKDYWENEIKKNKKHAYSIEALMNLSIIEMAKQESEDESQISNKIEMAEENKKIVLPDGEHLINGTVYIVEGGEVVSTKEVTPEQEIVMEEVAEESAEKKPEEMAETPTDEEEKKPEEMAEVTEEKKKPEEMAEVPAVETPTEEVQKGDYVTKEEFDELLTMVAEMKAAVEQSTMKEIEMSEEKDNRPFWRKISQGIDGFKASQN